MFIFIQFYVKKIVILNETLFISFYYVIYGIEENLSIYF